MITRNKDLFRTIVLSVGILSAIAYIYFRIKYPLLSENLIANFLAVLSGATYVIKLILEVVSIRKLKASLWNILAHPLVYLPVFSFASFMGMIVVDPAILTIHYAHVHIVPYDASSTRDTIVIQGRIVIQGQIDSKQDASMPQMVPLQSEAYVFVFQPDDSLQYEVARVMALIIHDTTILCPVKKKLYPAYFHISPQNAILKIDGQKRTNHRVMLTFGTYIYSVEAIGFITEQGDIEVPGRDSIVAKLRRVPPSYVTKIIDVCFDRGVEGVVDSIRVLDAGDVVWRGSPFLPISLPEEEYLVETFARIRIGRSLWPCQSKSVIRWNDATPRRPCLHPRCD